MIDYKIPRTYGRTALKPGKVRRTVFMILLTAALLWIYSMGQRDDVLDDQPTQVERAQRALADQDERAAQALLAAPDR